jgi:hypothetical protein
MDITRRALEGAFHTATTRETPTAGGSSSIILGGSTRKRRLTASSMGDEPTITLAAGRFGKGAADLTPLTGTKTADSVPPDSFLAKENERLRFELDNAKALQQILETNISSLREQLVGTQAHVAGLGNIIVRPSTDQKAPATDAGEVDVSVEGSDTPSNSSDARQGLEDSMGPARTAHDAMLERLSAAEDAASRLQLALSNAEASKNALEKENQSLKVELTASQASSALIHSERNELKEHVAKLEDSLLQADLAKKAAPVAIESPSEVDYQTNLEIQALKLKLQGAEETSAERASQLEAAQSKIRLLEQTMDTQDDDHLAYLKAKDDLEGWKAIFRHWSEEPTPQTVFARIRDLESNMQNQAEQQAHQRASPKPASPSDATQILENNVASLEKENIELRKTLKDQSQALEVLEVQILSLKDKLGSGFFNEETTKVIHLKRNPFHDAKMEQMNRRIDVLSGENQALKARLEVESTVAQGDGRLVQSGSATSSRDDILKIAHMQGEITALQKKLAEVSKSGERLKQVFSQQISTLRETIPKIFGYQLDMVSDPSSRDGSKATFSLYVCSSIPGRKKDERKKLVFKLVHEGAQPALRLVDTPFSRKHQKDVDTFIGNFDSIPAFVANLVLEDFQKRD